MKAHKLIFLIILIIVLEAVTDGLIYLSWTKHLPGEYHHIFQLVLFFALISFGVSISKITSKQFIWLFIAGTCLHFGLFDLIYGWISGNTIGTNSIADKVYNVLPILNNVIIRMLVAFGGIVLLIVKFPYKQK